MIRTNLFQSTDSHKIVEKMGNFSLLEYDRDISVTPDRAVEAYFSSRMNVRKNR